MGLSGNLESFGVPEILQLLGLQRKSGVLRLVRHTGEQRVLFFERGRVVATRERRGGAEDPLLQFLRGANYLTTDQLATIARVQAESGRDPVYIILSSEMIGRDRMIEAITQHTQQIVDNLLAWTQGTYEFNGDERSLPKLALKVPLSIEELLMEGMRRMDEVATIKQTALAPDLHLLKADTPLDRSSLSRELLVVYDLVGQTTRVETLVEHSPLGEYSTYEAISHLLESGLLVVDPCPPPPGEDPSPAPLEVVVPVSRHPINSTWVGVVALSVASLLLGLALGPALRSGKDGFLPSPVELSRHLADAWLASDVYAAEMGRKPRSIQELMARGYLSRLPDAGRASHGTRWTAEPFGRSEPPAPNPLPGQSESPAPRSLPGQSESPAPSPPPGQSESPEGR